ncbi:hypothetical protein FB451DRAFT_1390648 [Mycena latifolia]|nr:hypothetical protein FB451DRAFT_1390648 [Mycena latifolia]
MPPEGQGQAEEQAPQRPLQKPKKKALDNAVWNGAAPTGPKPKSAQNPKDGQTSSRKRAASTVQQSRRGRSDSDVAMDDVEGHDPSPLKATCRARKVVMDFESDPDSDREQPPQPQIKPVAAKPKVKYPAKVKPSVATAPEDLFTDDEEATSDNTGDNLGAGEEEDAQQDNGDNDLDGLGADALAQRLSDEVFQLRIVQLQAAFASIKAAHERVPAPTKPPVVAPKTSGVQVNSGPREKINVIPQSSTPANLRKLDLTQLPSWNLKCSVSHRPAGRSTARKSWTLIKREPQDVPLARPIKNEDGVSPAITLDEAETIEICYNDRNQVAMKTQHPDVKCILQLAIEYYLGFHMTMNFYPDFQLRTKFSVDSLTCAVRDLSLTAIHAKIVNEKEYREVLGTVPLGRISGFRGEVKPMARSLLYGEYKVQHNCADLVARLLRGEAYIYPHKPDTVDPRTRNVVHGKPERKQPYMHTAVPKVVHQFFQGQNSIAEWIKALFKKNEKGNYEATQPLVAISCAAIHSTLEDWVSGQLKQTNFDSSRVQDNYEIHIMLLQKIEKDTPERYHMTMEHIWTEVSCGSYYAKGPKAPPTLFQKEVLALLDLSD